MIINQHFVPQFYLRHFSFGTKKKQRKLWYLNKNNNEVDKDFVKNLASEDFFYEITPDLKAVYVNKFGYDDNFNEVEKYLSMIERDNGKELNALLHYFQQTQANDISDYLMNSETRLWLTFFICIMFYRTKKWRQIKAKQNIIKNKAMVETSSNIISQWQNYRFLKDLSEKEAILDQQLALLDLKGLDKDVNFIANCIWLLLENKTSVPFITSDNPVVRVSYSFMNNEYEALALPLNTKYLVIIITEPLNCSEVSQLSNKVQNVFIDHQVIDFNQIQYEQCSDLIFSSSNMFEKFI